MHAYQDCECLYDMIQARQAFPKWTGQKHCVADLPQNGCVRLEVLTELSCASPVFASKAKYRISNYFWRRFHLHLFVHSSHMHACIVYECRKLLSQPCNHNMYQIIIQSHDHDHKPSHWIHRVWHFFNKPLLNRSIRIVHVRLAPFGVTGRRRYMRYPRPCRMTPMNCCFIFLTLEPALPPCLMLGDPIFAWSAASAIIKTKPSSWSAPNL